jgi:hypothetical protein
MKSLKNGRGISVSVENITSLGVWLYVKGKEYFLDYETYPYFKHQPVDAIQDVKLLHGFHILWPALDVDLEIDNLENPEKYPIKNKI